MAKKAREGAQEARKPASRDARGRFTKKTPGEETGRVGTPFRTTDERAREAGKLSGAARREKGNLRKLCQTWMETNVGVKPDGTPLTGGEMMVQVAARELAKGNPRFWELLRDTAGYKPIDKVVTAEVDPAVIDDVERMVLQTEEDDTGD